MCCQACAWSSPVLDHSSCQWPQAWHRQARRSWRCMRPPLRCNGLDTRPRSGTIGTSCGKVATMYGSCASRACHCNLGERSSELAEMSEYNTSRSPCFRLIGSLSRAVRSREKLMLFASGMASCLRSNYRLCWVVRIVTIPSRQPSLCNTMPICRAAARESLSRGKSRALAVLR